MSERPLRFVPTIKAIPRCRHERALAVLELGTPGRTGQATAASSKLIKHDTIFISVTEDVFAGRDQLDQATSRAVYLHRRGGTASRRTSTKERRSHRLKSPGNP
uniref:hypothetical protein n=1 Tax=Rhizobium sp. F40D2 TaxID=3453141 RepID=UPI003F2080EC